MDPTLPIAQPVFSPVLQTRLMEDACIRADASQLRSKLEETRTAAAGARQDTGLPGRLLSALGGRKGGRRTPEEAAEIFARENVLQRQTREMEPILRHSTEELNTLIAEYLQEAVPLFRELSRARQRLAEWEGILQDLRADLRNLIKALGQARNSAVAGYDKNTRTISTAALELFGQAGELIHNVDARVRLANDKAAELGGLPGVAMIPLQEAVNNLTKLDIATMQREFDRLARELETFEQKQLVDLQAPVVAAAQGREAQAQAYLEQYREELRVFSDRQLKPGDVARTIPVILDRFRRR